MNNLQEGEGQSNLQSFEQFQRKRLSDRIIMEGMMILHGRKIVYEENGDNDAFILETKEFLKGTIYRGAELTIGRFSFASGFADGKTSIYAFYKDRTRRVSFSSKVDEEGIEDVRPPDYEDTDDVSAEELNGLLEDIKKINNRFRKK